MDVILKEGIDLLNEIGAKQSASEEILSKLGQGVTASFKVPIRTQQALLSSNATTIQGTGEGLLFVEFPGVSLKTKIIVDGVTIFDASSVAVNGARETLSIFFPFNKSFEVINNQNSQGVFVMYY